jgi:RNA polymerase-binding protein DksA
MAAKKKKSSTTTTTTRKKTTAKSAKKTSATTKTRKKPAPLKVKPLNKKEIDHFRTVLLQKRKELLGDVDSMSGNGPNGNHKESTGDLSSMPVHMADIGTDNYEQEFTLDLIEGERRLLQEIDHALSKILKGTYGICEATGKPIGFARLNANPYARFCIDFARKIEQGLASPPPINGGNGDSFDKD